MCEPVSMTALAIASAGASAYGQLQGANAQVAAANEAAAAQAEEVEAQQSQQAGERIRAARREAARARVAAGEAGVAGNSFEAQLRQSFGAANQDIAVIAKQGGFTERSINTNLRSNTAGTRGITPLSTGLQIASAGASGYASGLQIRQARED